MLDVGQHTGKHNAVPQALLDGLHMQLHGCLNAQQATHIQLAFEPRTRLLRTAS